MRKKKTDAEPFLKCVSRDRSWRARLQNPESLTRQEEEARLHQGKGFKQGKTQWIYILNCDGFVEGGFAVPEMKQENISERSCNNPERAGVKG